MPWMLLLLSIVTLGGCGVNSPTAPRMVNLGQDFELAPRQAGQVQGTPLTVTFERVSADSRCPSDAVCFWEGDATVLVTASAPPREGATLELHTTAVAGPTQRSYGEYTVMLVALVPQPRANQTIDAGAYRLTLRVSR